MIKEITVRYKIIFGFLTIIIGICLSYPWIYYPGTIFALVSLLTGMCFIATGALFLDIARNERFKQKHGEELWHPTGWKTAAVYILVRVLVRVIIALVVLVFVTFFMFK